MRKNVAILSELSYNVRRFEGEVPQRERKRSQRYLLHSDPRSGYPSPSRPWSTSDFSPQEDKTLRTWALTHASVSSFRLVLGVATRKKRVGKKSLVKSILLGRVSSPLQLHFYRVKEVLLYTRNGIISIVPLLLFNRILEDLPSD